MCNFNKQNEDTKALIHLFLTKAAENIGGVNPLLALIEAMKAQKPHALTFRACKIDSDKTLITWNKIVFKDKFEVLESILLAHRSSEDPDFNILNNDNKKQQKKILNMVKTLAPVEFIVTTKDSADGGGFNFKVFDTIKDDYVKINPIFVAMFFCSTEFTKKALKYTI
jgi:phenylpropionate dioxygenase-like ring-hydroxylating dioxygenase large terminal subunit